MIKITRLSLLCIGLLMAQAQAQPSGSDAQAAANKAQLLKGGRMSPRQQAEMAKAAVADTNQQSGADYLAANRAKSGVITLASGVQYKILTAGSGKRAAEQSSVRVRYQATLTDGMAFDKVDDKTATVMRVAGFVPGLKEAVKLMPAGSKWEVVIPPQLGYGPKGTHAVGPDAVLIYVIEILAVL